LFSGNFDAEIIGIQLINDRKVDYEFKKNYNSRIKILQEFRSLSRTRNKIRCHWTSNFWG